MKTLDLLAGALLIVGGLNWGLVALAEFDRRLRHRLGSQPPQPLRPPPGDLALRRLDMRTAAALFVLVALAVGAAPAAAAQQDEDIVDTAAAAEDFTTLTSLLKRAGLVSALREPGPFTVFAPTDAAFAKVPQNKLDALQRNRKKLRSVLLYHVVGKKLTAAQIVNRRRATTLNGKKVRFRVRDSKVYVNRARVTTADVGASNGVIHAIDRVLLPR
jgi:uncharacterized surface protein with fasciclin (FAS1) repeats